MNERRKKNYHSVMWMISILCLLVFIYNFIRVDYFFACDPAELFLYVVGERGILTYDKTRIVAHFLSEYPLVLASYLTNDFKILLNVYSSTPWAWLILSFILSFRFVDFKERGFLTTFIIIVCGIIVRAPVINEHLYTLVFIWPVLGIVFSKKEVSPLKECLIYALGGLSLLTHQASVFFYFVSLFYWLYETTHTQSLRRRMQFYYGMMLVAVIISVTLFKDAVFKSLFLTTFFSLEHIFIYLCVSAFLIFCYYSNLKSFLLLLAVTLSTYYLYDFSNMYHQFQSRVYFILFVSLIGYLVIYFKDTKEMSQMLQNLNKYGHLFSIFCVFLALPYFDRWENYFSDLKMDLNNYSDKSLIDYSKEKDILRIGKHGELAENWTISAQSLIAQIREDKTEFDRIMVSNLNPNADDVYFSMISAENIMKLSREKLHFSTKLTEEMNSYYDNLRKLQKK